MIRERFMENNIRWLDYLPLAVFAWGARLLGLTTQGGSWENAFYLGAATAVMLIIYKWYHSYSFDYIALGTYAFLIYGALAYAINPVLLLPYDVLKQAVIFAWVFIAGVITTLVTPEGFIQGPPAHRYQNIIGSIGLLALTSLALVVSYSVLNLTTAGTAVGTIIPFVGLLASRAFLTKYVEGQVKTSNSR